MNDSNNRLTVENPDVGGQFDGRSKLDKILGKHTNSVIVAILFLFTLCAFLLYIYLFKDKLSDTITTGFISLLSGLAGFFAASFKNN
ncbi:MAG TPA: hypothetical protein DGG95_07820 [Cytophagales bacterium]|jgi:hypothetical protein|nr:hypothetical protein [Cytophagales bacterium]